ncbi:ankyrin repeat domain-containing protein [Wolbachia endosymbiont of Pentidionis agamae]|uniref:ankyrin repeat domain-containing protein n=1 Tax=Wolbachia endosymbiont of Pentidionis agamae TaxID=3110435 RepID=UPI002FCE9A57
MENLLMVIQDNNLKKNKGFKKVSKLVQKIGINTVNSINETPLLLALELGEIRLAKFLIKRGADVNITTSAGFKPIHVAAAKGYTGIMINLINHESDINACTNCGNNPLHYAAEFGHEDAVKILIKKMANVNAINCQGETPLSLAINNGHTSVIKLLVSYILKSEVPSKNTTDHEEYKKNIRMIEQHLNLSSDDKKYKQCTEKHKRSRNDIKKKGCSVFLCVLLFLSISYVSPQYYY